jgi:hypothetical protein
MTGPRLEGEPEVNITYHRNENALIPQVPRFLPEAVGYDRRRW